MIEVEKKILLDEKQMKLIEKEAEFVNEETFKDIYFDTDNYLFTTNNIWLRQRDKQYQLKMGVRNENRSIGRFRDVPCECYAEVLCESEIFEYLGIEKTGSLSISLKKAKIVPFCTITTVRRKYKVYPFTIDIDLVDFGDYIYRLAEIEILVNQKSEIPDAEKEILRFVKLLDADPNQIILGKLIVYLSRKRPDHYDALINAKVIPDIR